MGDMLAEEFLCDDALARTFAVAAGLSRADLVVTEAIAAPSLGGTGFGRLLVAGRSADLKVTLLIEDKISAAPAARQADHYAARAGRLRASGRNMVRTVLVAPPPTAVNERRSTPASTRRR